MAESARTLIFPLWGPTGVKSVALKETECLFGRVVSLRSDLMRWDMLTPAEEEPRSPDWRIRTCVGYTASAG